MTSRLALAVAVLAAVACTRTVVDSHATGIEIATTIDAADQVTQLEIAGIASGVDVFAPGLVPSVPRMLSGEQTADVLLSPTLDGTAMLLRVDALAGSAIVHTGGGMVTVHAGELVPLEVTLAQPAICGDGIIVSPFETCDTGSAGGDGCSATCQVDPGWSCTGMPSTCTPLSSTKEITQYAFLAVDNPSLSSDVFATINGTTITATVPFGTDVTALVSSFTTTGASIRVGTTPQVSDTTPNNFSAPVAYMVTADDGSTKTYTVTVGVATNGAKDLTAFEFLAANNGALVVDIVGTINGTAIAATVPSGTSVTALVASFNTTGASVSVGGVAQTSGTTADNFTNPVHYTVTAADGSTKVYTVTVAIAPSSAKAITSYAFLSASNPTLGTNVAATINGTTIAATVPFGTDVTGLVATFATTGKTVAVGGAGQTSGTTPQNFTNPVAYTVTAANGSTQTFTVTVTIAQNSAKAITSYAFLSANNPNLGASVVATINGTTITATVPFGTAVTGLVATFSTTGTGVAVNTVAQTSSATPNDFTNPVQYVVTAADGSTQTYTVNVAIAKSSEKAITSFKFLSANNEGLGADVAATIGGTTISATVPFGTNVKALVATFSTTGASVAVGSVVQTSGTTPNNFTNPVSYTVTAADNSTQVFTVTVAIAPSSEKTITAFSFPSATNPGLGVDVGATINGLTITATVPFGTDVTGLVATFSTTGASVAIGAVAQTSGVTANDFTNPVEYTVTAADTSTQVYTVTVKIAPNSAKAITSFEFLSATNPDLGADVAATINGTTISATVPFGTTVTALIATFSTTGASVAIAGVVQTSGTTPNDFTNPVQYVVTAADNTTQTFTVTVTIAPSTAKAITSFTFTSANNPGLSADVAATITGTSIAATVPNGTDVTALVATFATTGASVNIAGAVQSSGVTPNDFTNQVTYTVVAADNSMLSFTVTVSIAPSTAKDITAYAFLSAHNSLASDATGAIVGTQITVTVPTGTDVTGLIATFTTTGQTVSVGGTAQASGATANDFTNPVTYTVTAADNSTQSYTVTVAFN